MKVGITGGIGAGKSTVSRIFGVLGVPLYCADAEAKRLMQTNPKVRAAILRTFGTASYRPDGKPDRAYLAKTVFPRPALLRKLNQIVHPAAAQHYADWHKRQRASGNKYTLKEAALLCETGSHEQMDWLILVTAPEAVRIQRVLARDSTRSEADTKSIIKNQMSDEEKIKFADFVIENNSRQMLIPQVLKLHRIFLDRSSEPG